MSTKEQKLTKAGWWTTLWSSLTQTSAKSPEKPPQELIILRGLPGSGKTTWARAWVLEDSKGRVRVNRDDIRRMLGQYWVPSREKLVTAIEVACVNNALRAGYSVVSDNTNFTTKVAPLGYYGKIIFHNIDTPIETCIERDSKRGSQMVGEKVIRDMYNKYLKPKDDNSN